MEYEGQFGFSKLTVSLLWKINLSNEAELSEESIHLCFKNTFFFVEGNYTA